MCFGRDSLAGFLRSRFKISDMNANECDRSSDEDIDNTIRSQSPTALIDLTDKAYDYCFTRVKVDDHISADQRLFVQHAVLSFVLKHEMKHADIGLVLHALD